MVGFSPYKNDLTLYFMPNLNSHVEILARLGKFKRGKGGLYLKRLADVDQDALRQLTEAAL
jgi:hypothetical protein